jgi:hypothetical protein
MKSPKLIIEESELELDLVLIALSQIFLNSLGINLVKKLHPVIRKDFLHPLKWSEFRELFSEVLDVLKNIGFVVWMSVSVYVWIFFLLITRWIG